MRLSTRLVACLVLAALAVPLAAHAQRVAWSRAYAGPSGAAASLGDGYIIGRSLAADRSGNVFATGMTGPAGNADFLTTKIDGASGAIAWQKTFAGAAGKDDVPMSVAADPSGNAIVAGITHDAAGNASIQVIKYAAANGAVAWQAALPGGTTSAAYVVATDSSGNAIVGAETDASGTSDVRIVKLAAANGTPLWDVTYDGGDEDFVSDLAVDASGNVVVAGVSVNTAGNQDFTILKLGAARGDRLWKRTYDSGGDDQAFTAALDSSGNAFVTGTAAGANRDLVTLKLAAADGSIAWVKTFDGGQDDVGQAVAVDASGNPIVAGQTRNAAGNFDFVTIKYATADGHTLWKKTFDGGADDWAYAVALDGSGNPYVAGTTSANGDRDWKVVAYAAGDGAKLYETTYGGSAKQADDAYAIAASAGGIAVGGTANESGSATGVRVMKLVPASGSDTPAPTPTGASSLTSPAPGTALGSTSIAFTWDAGSGVTNRFLAVGTRPGGNDIYGNYESGLSDTVSGLPSNGSTVYVTLMSMIGGAWQTKSYTYTAMSGGGSAIIYPVPGSTLSSSAVVFSWTAGANVTNRFLAVGLHPGGNEIYGGYPPDEFSQAVAGLPTDGRTIHVRLMSMINGTWSSFDYTYTAMTPAQATLSNMTSPVPGSALAPTTIFNWTAGSGVTNRFLSVGTILGGNDIYGSYEYGALSQRVSGIPRNGATIYVRLMSLIGGTWQTNDYIYTAANASRSVLTSPTPGLTLSGSSVTFTWDAGTNVTNRFLAVGTYLGGNDIYGGYTYGANSQTVNGLPRGRTIYVRLMSQIGGTWQYYDFTFAMP